MIRWRWLRRMLRRWLYGGSTLAPMARGSLFDRCMQKHFYDATKPSALR